MIDEFSLVVVDGAIAKHQHDTVYRDAVEQWRCLDIDGGPDDICAE